MKFLDIILSVALITAGAVSYSLEANHWYYTAEASELAKVGEVDTRSELQRIADCESGIRNSDGSAVPWSSRQFNEDGSVIVGRYTNPAFGYDVGEHQINTYWHGARAKQLGFDLYSEKGNEAYARLLYSEQGAKPWGWSKHCHGVQ
jgi:hypothetical protein